MVDCYIAKYFGINLLDRCQATDAQPKTIVLLF